MELVNMTVTGKMVSLMELGAAFTIMDVNMKELGSRESWRLWNVQVCQ